MIKQRKATMIATVASLLVLASLATAWACQPAIGGASLSPKSGPPGTAVTAAGSNAVPGQTALMYWNSLEGQVIGQGVVGSNGSYFISGTVPAGSNDGSFVVLVKAGQAGVSRSVFLVTSSLSNEQPVLQSPQPPSSSTDSWSGDRGSSSNSLQQKSDVARPRADLKPISAAEPTSIFPGVPLGILLLLVCAIGLSIVLKRRKVAGHPFVTQQEPSKGAQEVD